MAVYLIEYIPLDSDKEQLDGDYFSGPSDNAGSLGGATSS